MAQDFLVLEHITKIYGNGFIANKDVSLSVREGEIHALVGENGAGKSTLMKVLFGEEKPNGGKILLEGKEISIDNPTNAIKFGIGMVHQHFMLVPSLTVAENLITGMEPTTFGFFSMKKAVEITQKASEQYNLVIDPLAKIKDLPVGHKQKAEILKVLVRGAKIIILDEPTAVLTPQETKELFVELKNLKKQGYTIIFISHKLGEVMELCDRVTVMRAGRTIAVKEIADTSESDISRMMVGRDIILKIEKTKAEPKEAVLEIANLSKKRASGKAILDNVSFRIRKGEILGIAGVEGNGQREISEIVTGMEKKYSGTAKVNGHDVKGLSIREIRKEGTSHISEDRMTYGIVADGSIEENIISDRYYKAEYQKKFLLNTKKIDDLALHLIGEFDVKCDGKDQPIRMLSGGNMQKVVAAREFTSGATLIVANQPTRGIDIGASDFIRKKLIELRDEGAGVLLISADLNEVIETSDSLIVMSDGKIAAYFEDTKDITEEELGEYMLGIKKMSEEKLVKAAHD